MSSQQSVTHDSRSVLRLPSNPVAYVAVLAALVSAAIHLLLAPRVMGFNQTMGVLFYLNGLGWVGGTLLFLSRFWRRELYLVAAGYALVTIVAFFVMGGRVNTISIASKAAEAAFVLVAVYLYTTLSRG
jgi:hypothetical protein